MFVKYITISLLAVALYIASSYTAHPIKQSNQTMALIKPDAVAAGNTGTIINLIENNKFTIRAMRKTTLSRKTAEHFYNIHTEKPFFKDLITYMTSGPVVVLALEKENAVADWRKLMGATNPAKAEIGTMRYMFGSSVTQNATHGSDTPESAHKELNFFFPNLTK